MIEHALYAASAAVVFASVRPGMFAPWYALLLWMETRGKILAELSKPLGACHKCMAGQVALWSHLYMYRDPVQAGVTACLAILIAEGLNKAHEWSNQY